jgi:hypothetical protein
VHQGLFFAWANFGERKSVFVSAQALTPLTII